MKATSHHADKHTISIMGTEFTIKCPPAEVAALQQCVDYLNLRMSDIYANGQMNYDRAITLTALNVTRELLRQQNQSSQSRQDEQRLQTLIAEISHTLGSTKKVSV